MDYVCIYYKDYYNDTLRINDSDIFKANINYIILALQIPDNTLNLAFRGKTTMPELKNETIKMLIKIKTQGKQDQHHSFEK